MYDISANLAAHGRFGITAEQVVERSGLDGRTIKGLLVGTDKPDGH